MIYLVLAKGKAITDIDIYIFDNDKLETSDIKMFYINYFKGGRNEVNSWFGKSRKRI